MVNGTAKVIVKNDSGKVVGEREYQKVWFEGIELSDKGKPIGGTADELLAAAIQLYVSEADKDGNGVLDALSDLTYARDLKVRSKIRQAIEASLAGPDKAIEQALKRLIAVRTSLGKPVTEEWIAKRKAALLAEASED